MTSELKLRRKWTLKAHGKQVVFVKHSNERPEHVIMKALLWALYLPRYPDLGVEIAIGDRYKPDVVELTLREKPRFWGEAGEVGEQKIRSLAKRFRDTHFAIAKWDTRLDPLIEIVSASLEGLKRSAPFDLITFPDDSVERFLDDRGNITITHDDIEWVRLPPG
jgi:hypothetical protein